MPEFALIKNGEFVEVRRYDTQPEDIAHKDVQWLPVVRETVDETVTGNGTQSATEHIIETSRYLIRTTVTDIPTNELVASMEVTPYQARIALHMAGMLATVEAMMDNPATPAEAKIAWEYAITFQRNSPFIMSLGPALGLTDAQIDDLFLAASKVE